MNLFELAAKISLDTGDYEKGLGEASKTTSSFGDKLKSGLKTAAKVGAAALGVATTAIVALTKSAVENYSEYEQLVGGVETLFDKSSNIVMQYANNAYKTAGLSANDYMETVTSFSASLLQSLNGDTAKSAEIADLAITDMADNANKMGSSMESIQNAYQGFAKQNYTMLDNLKLGYGGTKSEMERLIADANKVKKANGEMANLSIESFADIVEAIHIVQSEMGITGTTADEAANTIQGSVSSAKAAWENFVTGLGDKTADLKMLTTNLINSIVTVASNLAPVIQTTLESISEAIPEVINQLTPLVPQFLEIGIDLILAVATGIIDNLPALIESGTQIMLKLTEQIIEMLPTILETGLDIIVALALGIADSLPELIPTVVDVILKMVEILTDPENLTNLIDAALQIIIALADGLVEAIPKIVEKIPVIMENLLSALIQALPLLVNAGVQLMGSLAEGILSYLTSIVKIGANIVDKVKEGFSSKIQDAKTWGKDMIQNFIDGITAKWQALKDKVSNVAQTVKDFLGFSLPKKGPLHTFDKSGSDMVDVFIKGIKDSEYKIEKEITSAFSFDIGTLTGQITGSGTGFGVGRSITMTNNFYGGYSERDGAKILRSLNRQLGAKV